MCVCSVNSDFQTCEVISSPAPKGSSVLMLASSTHTPRPVSGSMEWGRQHWQESWGRGPAGMSRKSVGVWDEESGEAVGGPVTGTRLKSHSSSNAILLTITDVKHSSINIGSH